MLQIFSLLFLMWFCVLAHVLLGVVACTVWGMPEKRYSTKHRLIIFTLWPVTIIVGLITLVFED